MLFKRALAFSGVLTAVALGAPAFAQDQFLGQIITIAGVKCPPGWIEANGQIMSAAQNQALYGLFGNTYGGAAPTTFALPDLRGRGAMGDGASFGAPQTNMGDKTGEALTLLSVDNLPAHTHTLPATGEKPDVQDPTGATFATYGPDQKIYAKPPTVTAMAKEAVTNAGSGGEPIPNYQPSLVLRFCVAIQGAVPKKP